MLPENYECEGQMSFFDCFDEKEILVPTSPLFKIHNKVRLIECFGGIGSQAKSLELLGVDFEHYRLIEYDKYPVASYNAIHGTNFEPKDITKIHSSDLGIVDRESFTYLLTYSFPCQDISVAGLCKGFNKENQINEETRTRSGLLWEVERILNECGEELPQVLLMENVKNLIGSKFKPDFDKWCEYLESKGYKNTYKVLNAKDYGIPQNRERVFMVSTLEDKLYEFPKPIPLETETTDYLEEKVEKNYYVTKEKARTLVEKLIFEGKLLENV